jgi:hypothetical protein
MVEVKCSDFLNGNDHLYARKARRKKIALILIVASNRGSSAARLMLGTSRLTSGGRVLGVEAPATTIRRLSEFTWEFLLYSVIDFQPITAMVDVLVLLSGPLYNRRLRRQLALLADSDLELLPGESKSALIAFRGITKDLERIMFTIRCQGREETVEYPIDNGQ